MTTPSEPPGGSSSREAEHSQAPDDPEPSANGEGVGGREGRAAASGRPPGEPKIRPFHRSRSSSEGGRGAEEDADAQGWEKEDRARSRGSSGASLPGLAALGRAGARAAGREEPSRSRRRAPSADRQERGTGEGTTTLAPDRGVKRAGAAVAGVVGAGLGLVSNLGSGDRRARRALVEPRRQARYRADGGVGSWWTEVRTALITLVVLAVCCGLYGMVQILRPSPTPAVVGALPAGYTVPGPPPAVPWPRGAEAEVRVAGVGTMGPVGGAAPVPVGSVAKIMAAYVILHDHPLPAGAQGPLITITPGDVALYHQDVANGDSVVKVAAGERLTERQALEGLLAPSGDNIATLLATWDAGSMPAFLARMNATAAHLGMTHTHYADASGLSPQTVSTPSDQLRLAPRAMANPTFAHIVGMRQVVLPVAGVQYNTNGLLGHDGIVGIKTGSTGQANGCLVFVAHAQAAGRMRTLYGAVFGVKPAPGQGWLTAVSLATAKLLPAVTASIRPVKVLSPGAQAARVVAPWGASTPALATNGVTLVGWPGLPVRITPVPSSKLSPTMPPNVNAGQGRVQVGAQEETVGLRTTKPIKGPTLRWKLGQV